MIHYISGDMVRQVLWTKRVLDAFIMEGNLNRRQEFILRGADFSVVFDGCGFYNMMRLQLYNEGKNAFYIK